MTDSAYYTATLVNLLINLIYMVVALGIGIGTFRYIDRIFFKDIDFIEEIRRGNVAASIFASTIFFFIAIVIGFALKS